MVPNQRQQRFTRLEMNDHTRSQSTAMLIEETSFPDRRAGDDDGENDCSDDRTIAADSGSADNDGDDYNVDDDDDDEDDDDDDNNNNNNNNGLTTTPRRNPRAVVGAKANHRSTCDKWMSRGRHTLLPSTEALSVALSRCLAPTISNESRLTRHHVSSAARRRQRRTCLGLVCIALTWEPAFLALPCLAACSFHLPIWLQACVCVGGARHPSCRSTLT